MQHAGQIESIAYEFDSLLSAYVSVHDRLLKQTATPISLFVNLFRKVDYESYFQSASHLFQDSLRLWKEVKDFKPTEGSLTEQEKNFVLCLSDYAVAIVKTMSAFSKITHNIWRRAKALRESVWTRFNLWPTERSIRRPETIT